MDHKKEAHMIYRCSVCNWEYDEEKGIPENEIAPNTPFDKLPETWLCPVCMSDKTLFSPIEKQPQASQNSISESSPPEILNTSIEVIEPELQSIIEKAKTGKIELSSMRSLKHKNQLDEIIFIPGQLNIKPLREDEVKVNTKTIIGPKAKKPLELAIPFFVSHMSFGALSKEAKIALAKGAALCKTAIGSGEGGMLPEERDASFKYIFEYSTGRFGATEEVMKQADAIEIKIGQAAKAGLGGHLPHNKVTEEIAKVRGVQLNSMVISPANHSDINGKEDLKKKVDWLRDLSDGVPIGIKLVAGDIENDLRIAIFANPDFITFDCRGGATGTAPIHIKDNFSIPAPYALSHIKRYFQENNVTDISLVIAGGMRTSADIAKCMAMGATAVALGTVSMIGIGCEQYRQCHTGNCPKGIATQNPDLRKRFDIENSATQLSNLFKVYTEEIEDYIRVVGKKDVHTLDTEDLVTLSEEIAQFTGIRHV